MSVPSINIGDRVLIKQGRLTRTENILFGGSHGVVSALMSEHGMTVALVKLTKRNAAGQRICIRKPISELHVLVEGEWRMPAQRPRWPEHETVIGGMRLDKIDCSYRM